MTVVTVELQLDREVWWWPGQCSRRNGLCVVNLQIELVNKDNGKIGVGLAIFKNFGGKWTFIIWQINNTHDVICHATWSSDKPYRQKFDVTCWKSLNAIL